MLNMERFPHLDFHKVTKWWLESTQ